MMMQLEFLNRSFGPDLCAIEILSLKLEGDQKLEGIGMDGSGRGQRKKLTCIMYMDQLCTINVIVIHEKTCLI